MKLQHVLCALLVTLAATIGLAHAQAKKGPNGGTIVTTQGHPVEFVAKGDQVTFYIDDDDGSPLETKDMRGRATIQDAGKTMTVTLQPAEPNMLVGKLTGPLASKARVAFSATFRAGGHAHTLTARYVVD